MLAVHAAAVDVIESFTRRALEMMRLVTVETVVAAAIPEGAFITPIAVVEGAVKAIIITVIIIGSAGGDTDAERLARLAAGQQGQGRKGDKRFTHVWSPAGQFFNQQNAADR